jgi:hypothetical protein
MLAWLELTGTDEGANDHRCLPLGTCRGRLLEFCRPSWTVPLAPAHSPFPQRPKPPSGQSPHWPLPLFLAPHLNDVLELASLEARSFSGCVEEAPHLKSLSGNADFGGFCSAALQGGILSIMYMPVPRAGRALQGTRLNCGDGSSRAGAGRAMAHGLGYGVYRGRPGERPGAR